MVLGPSPEGFILRFTEKKDYGFSSHFPPNCRLYVLWYVIIYNTWSVCKKNFKIAFRFILLHDLGAIYPPESGFMLRDLLIDELFRWLRLK